MNKNSSSVESLLREGEAPVHITRRRAFKFAGLGLLGLGLFKRTGEAISLQTGGIIVQVALSKVGLPYQWGATDISKSADCSLLTQWAYSMVGIRLPRTAAEQYSACRYCALPYTPGVLLFFATNPNAPRAITHVAIGCGSNGNMVSANSEPSPGKVTLVPNWAQNSYWRPKFLTAASL